MVESDRHQNCILKLKGFLRALQARILENDNSRGIGGYQFEPIYSEKAGKPVQYIADVLAILPGGAVVDFEVNHKYHNNLAADNYRTAQLAKWFIKVISLTPAEIDIIRTKEDLEAEIDFWVFGKRKEKIVVV
jgi:hypothetical protein